MSSNCLLKLNFLLFLLALIAPGSQMDWQSSGNMSESNITEIHTTIQDNPINSTRTDAQIDSIAQSMSTRFNLLWAPAWNVVLAKSVQPYDTVLYGYAFRDHWVWINGVAVPSTTKIISYLIWKDYNCNGWKSLTTMKASSSTFLFPLLLLATNKAPSLHLFPPLPLPPSVPPFHSLILSFSHSPLLLPPRSTKKTTNTTARRRHLGFKTLFCQNFKTKNQYSKQQQQFPQ